MSEKPTQGRVRTLIEGFGVLSVVVSLVFVAIQINQSNAQARAAVAYDLHESFNGYHDLVASDAELGAIVSQVMIDASHDLTPSESARAFSLAVRLLNTWLSVQAAFDRGLIEEPVFAGYQADVAAAVRGLPGFMPYWTGMIEERPGLGGALILAPIVAEMPTG